MKYDQYKNLTKDQKEEYNYRFKENPSKEFVYAVAGPAVFTALALFIVTVAALWAVNPNNTDPLERASQTFEMATGMLYAGAIIFIGFSLGWMIDVVRFEVSYRKWKKNNNLQLVSLRARKFTGKSSGVSKESTEK